MRIVFCFVLVVFGFYAHSQTVSERLKTAYVNFEADSQLGAAITSLYVVDAETGKVLFDKNSRIGLAPASTQKVITVATAYDLLGREFRYKTVLGFTGDIKDGVIKSSLFLEGTGDPTFGSWRYKNTTPGAIFSQVLSALKDSGVKTVTGPVELLNRNFDIQKIPDGWIWQDIGQYYGAGAGSINWHENQYDIILKPGSKPGDSVRILRTVPDMQIKFQNQLKTGARNSGDNSYLYFNLSPSNPDLQGTVPCCVDSFVISGAVANGEAFAVNEISTLLAANKLQRQQLPITGFKNSTTQIKPIYTHYSPPLDSIVHWLFKKSINLYAEALLKTIALNKKGFASTPNGIEVIRSHWKTKGINPIELNIADGSGLSPANRVTTHAEVQVLQYAKAQAWFPGYYAGFPEYNNMKMKSGTIGGVKGFCGYHKSKEGKEYIFSFLVNNYNGSSSKLVEKMYKVLDELK